MKALGFTLSVIVLLILCAAGYVGYQAFNTGIEEAKITSVTPTTEGFTLSGTLTVKNPSYLPIPIQKGEYTVTLENRETIGKGTIDGKTLQPQTTTPLPFTQDMKWVPSTELLLTLVLKEHVYANIKGTITLDFFGLKQLSLPFEQRIDLAEYVNALKKNIVQNVVNAAGLG